MANIATTGNIAVFIDPVSQFHSHWKANPATSCGAVDPSEAQTSVDLVLNGQNTHVSAIQHMLKVHLWPQRHSALYSRSQG